MKWPHGLAIITRPEHWEKAAQHLWGMSLTEIGYFLGHAPQSAPSTIIPPKATDTQPGKAKKLAARA
jgi:hypothetical protein